MKQSLFFSLLLLPLPLHAGVAPASAHPPRNMTQRDPFAPTLLMQGGFGAGSNDTELAPVLSTLKLRGIVKGRALTALIETERGVWSLQQRESFELQAAQQRHILQVRAIHDDSVEIGTAQQTLTILR